MASLKNSFKKLESRTKNGTGEMSCLSWYSTHHESRKTSSIPRTHVKKNLGCCPSHLGRLRWANSCGFLTSLI